MHTEIFKQIAGQLATIVEKGRLYQQLTELNALKSKFLGMAAHDLRNPLSGITGLLDLLLDGSFGPLTAEQNEMLVEARTASESMLASVNDLLDVTAVESGHVALQLEPEDITAILETCRKSNRMFASHKSIELKIEASPDLPNVRVDVDRIKQVVNNLISNAIKYSVAGTTVTIVAARARCS